MNSSVPDHVVKDAALAKRAEELLRTALPVKPLQHYSQQEAQFRLLKIYQLAIN